jgi:multiple sugar transport system substrate-binding protein
MRRQLVAPLTIGLVAALALGACSSSKKSAATSPSSSTVPSGAATSTTSAPAAAGSSAPSSIPAATLKLVAADYGNGPTAANSGQTFWQGIVTDFNKVYPQIKVNVQVINWNDVDNDIATMVQNGQEPDIAQGSADYAGVTDKVYPTSQILSPETQANLLKGFADQGQVNGVEYGIHLECPRAVQQQGPFHEGRHLESARDVGRLEGGRGQAQGGRRARALRVAAWL